GAPSVRAGRPRVQAREIAAGLRDTFIPAPKSVSWETVDPRVDLRYVPTASAANIPDGDAVIATAWQTADPVARLGPQKGRGCYFIQHHETWSGRAARVDETWRLPLRVVVLARWLYERAVGMGVSDVRLVPSGMDTDKYEMTRVNETRPRRVAMLY